MRVELCEEMQCPQTLALALGADLTAHGAPAPRVTGIATDSREVEKGDLFAALAGERTNGGHFAGEALSRGAAALLSVPDISIPSGDFWHFTTPSPEAALLRAAAVRRRESGAFVIAVTGSCGKTTVKEAIAAVLGGAPHSAGNFNSTVGMPLSVLRLPRAPYWVLELGINHVGEMEAMAKSLAPDLGVITNVGTAHIGLFGDRRTLLAEKCSLSKGLCPGGGLLVPEDLEIPPFLAPSGGVFRVGTSDTADFRAENIVTCEKGVTCDLRGCGRVITNLAWPIPGRVGVSVLSLAGAVGLMTERTDEEIRAGLALAGADTPRMRQVRLGDSLLLDDTYNASPESVAAALETLGHLAAGRPRVAVLGDMLELGAHERRLHEETGKTAAFAGLSSLVTYGDAAAAIGEGAVLAGMPQARVRHFAFGEEEALCDLLLRQIDSPSAILLKASRKMRLERVAKILGERYGT